MLTFVRIIITLIGNEHKLTKYTLPVWYYSVYHQSCNYYLYLPTLLDMYIQYCINYNIFVVNVSKYLNTPVN